MPRFTIPAAVALALGLMPAAASAAPSEICEGFGPQAPRDIRGHEGVNPVTFDPAPPAAEMNLCNIHTHTHAEHKGPGFHDVERHDPHGGYQCNAHDRLKRSELRDPAHRHGAFHGARTGDTLEVHWVYTTCDTAPGKGLDACVPEGCQNPQLRVESQVFLLVNHNPDALDFADFAYEGPTADGLHQPRALPEGTGTPVVFLGSTTGPEYTSKTCSPVHVTWSVRPDCAKLDIGSVHDWSKAGNVFGEHHSHGVRHLVTAPELLAPIN